MNTFLYNAKTKTNYQLSSSNKNPNNKDLLSIFGLLILLTLLIISKCQN
jgi:hypothetical protein